MTTSSTPDRDGVYAHEGKTSCANCDGIVVNDTASFDIALSDLVGEADDADISPLELREVLLWHAEALRPILGDVDGPGGNQPVD